MFCFFFQAEDGIRDVAVTGVQTCALPIFGYGRDWRTGVYMDVGGKDAKDARMGGNYLKSLPNVDANRIGVWGLGYGGFFTPIALTAQPTLVRARGGAAGSRGFAEVIFDPTA